MVRILERLTNEPSTFIPKPLEFHYRIFDRLKLSVIYVVDLRVSYRDSPCSFLWPQVLTSSTIWFLHTWSACLPAKGYVNNSTRLPNVHFTSYSFSPVTASLKVTRYDFTTPNRYNDLSDEKTTPEDKLERVNGDRSLKYEWEREQFFSSSGAASFDIVCFILSFFFLSFPF